MKTLLVTAIGLAFAASVAAAFAAPKHAAQKGPPPCSALTFRALPAGAADGDQQAGFYRSRFGTLAVHAEVKDGKPTDYFVLADGKRLTAAPAALPDWAASCAEAKKLPKPGAAASSCTGERFRVVLAHQGDQRLALLYGSDGSSWHYCSAGSY